MLNLTKEEVLLEHNKDSSAINREKVSKKNSISKGYLFIKRVIDIVGSFFAIIILSPVLLIFALAVKIQDGGTSLYKQKRLGKNGKDIYVYKFRSMCKNADDLKSVLTKEQLIKYQEEFKLDDDPRITKLGRFIRKTSIDELPQLFNIFLGDLSFVGPRPVLDEEADLYGEQRDKFLSVKPGLTGYWQTYGRNKIGYKDGKRQEMELFYVDNCSLWFDIKILFKTVLTVLKSDGAQ
ncbi:MAG: sugar transferase [Acutalibacteraceae bacterium]